jgi:hypothetical protein
MRLLLVAALLGTSLVGGCLDGDGGSNGALAGPSPSPEVPHGSQAILLDERFTAALGVPWTWTVELPAAARNVVVDLDQDSGAIPNLRVELEGCGGADAPGSASRQTIALCSEPSAGERTFAITVNAGLPAGNGNVVLRADLV